MNLQQIEYIIALSELRNFGKAAEHCFVTQPTLSTMIARFEEEIGIRLFDRKTKPVTITREGEEVIRQLRIIAREVDNLQHVVSRLKGEEAGGVLKIGVIPTIAPYLLPRFLMDFVRRYPRQHFVFSELTTDAIIEALKKRELDVGIVSIPLDHPELEELPLYDEPFLLLDKAENGLEDFFALSEIDLNRLWLLEEGHCMRNQVEKICGLQEKQGTDRNLDYRSGAIDTLLKFVDRYQGITLLPWLATLDLPEEDRPHLKRFREPVPTRSVGLLVHRHFVKRRLLEVLQQEIQESISPLLPDTAGKVVAPV